MQKRLTALLASFVISLGLTVPAIAQTGDRDGNEGAVVKAQTGGGADPNPTGGRVAAHDPADLPFTGLDLAPSLAFGAVLLLGARIGMCLLTRSAQRDHRSPHTWSQRSPAALPLPPERDVGA